MTSQITPHTTLPAPDDLVPSGGDNVATLEWIEQDTRELLLIGAHTNGVAWHEWPDDPGYEDYLLDGLAEALAQARDALTDAGRSERQRHRGACDALALHLFCTHAACRKAHACRGEPVACFQRANVPARARELAAAYVNE